MKWGSRLKAGQALGVARGIPSPKVGADATTCGRGADPGMLRLSYILRADLLLRGRAGRSEVLAEIHRRFDASAAEFPSAASLADLARLIDAMRGVAARSPEARVSPRVSPSTGL